MAEQSVMGREAGPVFCFPVEGNMNDSPSLQVPCKHRTLEGRIRFADAEGEDAVSSSERVGRQHDKASAGRGSCWHAAVNRASACPVNAIRQVLVDLAGGLLSVLFRGICFLKSQQDSRLVQGAGL